MRPLVHFAEIGALGPHVLLGHAVHLDDDEIETLLDTGAAVAYCPWAYVRLAQGVVRGGRHDEIVRRGGRVALGCDSENAGDQIDVLRAAALAAGLARDRAEDPRAFGAHEALALATCDGARAIGLGDLVGSLEVGKRADIVVHRSSSVPAGGDVELELVWGTDGRSVTHVLVDGVLVVRDGRVLTVDVDALAHSASARSAALLRSIGR
jgi:5-methylthioadenosine/S-adenosylhomocysteine deaminase